MKSKNLFKGILITVAAAMIFTSCNTGEYKGFKKSGSGIYYKLKSDNNTDTTRVRIGKIVAMDLKYGFKDSVFFDSKTRPGEMKFAMQAPTYEADFYEAIQLFHQGDSGAFILKAGPFFTKTVGQPQLPPNVNEEDDIYFDFFIKSVQTEEEMQAAEAAKAEELRQLEGPSIAGFVAERNITVQPDTSGIYYVEKVAGKGKSPKKDEYATVHFNVYKLDGEKLFSTVENGEPLEFQIGSRFENEGFQRVVQMMKPGGKAEAIVPSSLAFGAQGAGQIVPPYSPLFYEVDLISTMTKEAFDKKQAEIQAQQKADEAKREQQESIDLQKYLKDNNITETPRESGLIYLETMAGNGAQPQAGQKVKVHYTGRLLDGTKFDSSVDRGQPFEFTLGQGQVIRGWDEGIGLMKEGGKATLIIPSKIGYGARGAGEMIPPFSSLVFDVELIEIIE